MGTQQNIDLSYFETVRNWSEILCAPLHKEDYVPQPAEFTSPPKWHLAHTTWFFEQFVLAPNVPGYQVFDKDFSYLFNSYYNNVGKRTVRNQRGLITRPTVDQVYAYRKYIDKAIKDHWEHVTASPSILKLLNLGLNHEQQHQELLITDLKYTLSLNPLFPVYQKDGALVNSRNDNDGFVTLSEGVYDIGYEGEGFHFDNEEGKHKVYCQQTDISQTLVTNAEYLEFIAAGGYDDFNLWLDEGWTWKRNQGIKSPLFWHYLDNQWHTYTLGGLQKLDPNGILCHISYYEACAYAEWKGMRLLTEFEWEAAQKLFQWGDRWEWTQSAYLPYPGFSKAEGAVGEYNGKFMVNQMVLRGSSVATSPGHQRATYRNFFHPHFQWQFTGIRLAKK